MSDPIADLAKAEETQPTAPVVQAQPAPDLVAASGNLTLDHAAAALTPRDMSHAGVAAHVAAQEAVAEGVPEPEDLDDLVDADAPPESDIVDEDEDPLDVNGNGVMDVLEENEEDL